MSDSDPASKPFEISLEQIEESPDNSISKESAN